MANIIEIKGLTKKYGQLTALNNLDLEVEQGAVIGFLGPNGAGKTTTMRILTTLLEPTAGDAWIAGHNIHKDRQGVRQAIGYMPDYFGVYEDMKVWEYLDFFAACYDIPQQNRDGMIDDLLTLVDLGHKKDSFVEGLSRGMKQRLCLARTLAHDPQVLFLDEPASGLDPRARIEMRELLRELKNMGKTIFFSSHILSEVADICTSIAVLEAGNLIAYGNIADMKKRLQPHRVFAVRLLGDDEDLQLVQETLLNHPQADFLPPEDEEVRVEGELLFTFTGDDRDASMLLGQLVSRNVPIISFAEREGDLEDVFLKVTQGIVN
ncbi:MAG: ABC transporter ATP-binding protein [Anaerolineales bacterium]|nr:ABC transporter ATP-binding protein [Anaerolineales bacterium]MCB0011728.1 ABC transporter ATP-binding protein [Anaerolineales bacterium]MCB8959611.1 ABC transporter ATP-binding protein [Ardenticatenales bacterium]